MSQFCYDNDVFFEFHLSRCFVKDQNTHTTLLEGTLSNDLYTFSPDQLSIVKSSSFVSSNSHSQSNCTSKFILSVSRSSKGVDFSIWHNRLGHPSPQVVKSVLSKCNVSNINKDDSFFCFIWEIFINFIFLVLLLPIIHPCNLCTLIFGDHHISFLRVDIVAFIDAFTKFTWIYLLKHKSDALQMFINFKIQVELQTSHKIKSLQSDYIVENGLLFFISSGCPCLIGMRLFVRLCICKIVSYRSLLITCIL